MFEESESGAGHKAVRHRQAKELGFAIDIAPHRAALHPHDTRLRVHAHATHQSQVDHQPAIAHRRAGDVVATATHREQ